MVSFYAEIERKKGCFITPSLKRGNKYATEMSQTVPQPKLFACSQSKILAENIAKSYGQDLGNVITSTYSDGEFQPSFEESVRGVRTEKINPEFQLLQNSWLAY